MQDVTEMPSTHELIDKNPNPYRGDERKLAKLTPAQLQESILATRDRLMKANPKHAWEIETVYQSIYNFFLVDEGLEETHTGEGVLDKIEVASRIQHNFAHNVFYAAHEASSANFIIGMYRIVAATEYLSRRPLGGTITRTQAVLLSGMKGELAIMKTLREEGMGVYVPNYAQRPEDGKLNEVREIDIRSGIDLLVTDGPNVYLVDVKVRAGAQQAVVEDSSLTSSGAEKHIQRNFLLDQALEEFDSANVKRAVVVVPASQLRFQPHDYFSSINDYREELQKYCRLNPEAQFAIVAGLRNLPHKK